MRVKEIWKEIENFSNYEVSSCGKVRVFETKRNSQSFLSGVGLHKHPYVCLFQNNKKRNIQISRLVAENFLEKQTNTSVIHIDGNIYNNNLVNLKWGSHKEAVRRTRGLED